MLKRKFLIFCTMSLLVTSAWSADANPLASDKAKLSYSIGASIGKNLSKDGTEVDLDVLIGALKDSLAGKKLLLNEKELRQVMSEYEGALRKQIAAKRQKAAIDNRQKGEAFVGAFKKQPGVQVSPGGVLYQVITAGSGDRRPSDPDTVQVNYRGTLIDGTQFDATEPGKPAELKVVSLISGWKQALSMMNVGSKWHLVIPAELAYGERGVGSDIGPNEVLVFDVELVGIK